MRLALLPQLLTLTLHSTSGLAQPIPALAEAIHIPTFDISIANANAQSLSGTSSINAPPTDISVHANGFSGYTYPTYGNKFTPTITPRAQFDGRCLKRFLHLIHDVMIQNTAGNHVTARILKILIKWGHSKDLNLVPESLGIPNPGLIWVVTKDVFGGLPNLFAGANGHRVAPYCVNLANGTLNGRRNQNTPQTKLVRSLPVPHLMNRKNL